jgi:hypothetical protein
MKFSIPVFILLRPLSNLVGLKVSKQNPGSLSAIMAEIALKGKCLETHQSQRLRPPGNRIAWKIKPVLNPLYEVFLFGTMGWFVVKNETWKAVGNHA